MAVLYRDQYEAMSNLGTDERYVLSHLACGYDIGQIKVGLSKRGDRDTKDDVETLVERIYAKLGVSKSLKPSEQFRKAGKIHFDYSEMLKEKRGPRPGNAPLDELDPEHVDDDEVIARNADRFNGTKLNLEEDADEEKVGTEGAPAPPAPPVEKQPGSHSRWNTDVEYDPNELAKKVPKLKEQYIRLLGFAAQTSDVSKIAKSMNLSESTVKAYLGQAAIALGVHVSASWQTKFSLSLTAFKLAQEGIPDLGKEGVTGPERASAPSDHPPAKEAFALPDEGTVVTFADPGSVEDVKVGSDLHTKKYRDAGYTIEHIVLPPDSASGFTHYVFVKRKKSE